MTLTKEAAMARFMASKKKKQKYISQLEKKNESWIWKSDRSSSWLFWSAMKEPELNEINKIASYQVTKSDQPLSYDFVTDYGVRYNISFLYDDTLLEREAYQLVIANWKMV